MQVRCIAYAATLTLLALQTSSTSVTEGIDFIEPGRGGSSSSSSGTASRLDPTNPPQRVDHEDMTTLSSLSVVLKRSSRNLAGEPGHLHSSHDGHHHHDADVSAPESATRIETSMIIGHHVGGRTHDDVHQHEQPYSYFTMHLPGFRSSWNSLAQSKERLTYLGLVQVRGIPTLLFAVLLSFGLSFGLEYVTSRRQRKQPSKQGRHQQQHQMNRQQQRALTAHHAIVSLLTHVAMLVAMTYSLELMVALVVGRMAGYYSCHSPAKEQHRSSSQQALEDGRRRRQSPHAQHAVVSRLQRLWRNRFDNKGSNFRLLAFPAARERIRRQAYPERSGGREKDVTVSSVHQLDGDAEAAEAEESTRDDDEVPLLRKRETKR